MTLAQAQIPFEPSPDGAGILVPAAQLDKARLATAAKGGVKSGRLGFEIFDKPNWVGSEFDEQVNYQRALEGELEHTVGTLSDVESARVHLVLPHDSLFQGEERPAKASVVLKLRRSTLADGEPEAIRNLVASAVDGLTPDHVVLVDASGNLPLGPKTPEAMQLSAEQALEDKLISTLEPVTGAGNVRASVTLDYDETATDETAEVYDPDKTATLAMQRTEQTTGAQPVAAGVPGTASNAPNTQALPVYPHETTPPQTAKSESSTYGVSKTVRHTVENPGRVRRLTAAIVVNDRLITPATKNHAAVWQPRSADELRNLTALAQAAVGFDTARGDVVTVEDLAFDGNQGQPPAGVSEQMLNAAENSPMLVKYARAAAGLFVVVAFAVRPAIRHAGAALAVRGPQKAAGRELAASAIGGIELSRAGADGSGAAAQSGDLRAGDGAHQARTDAKLAPAAKLDSLRVAAAAADGRQSERGREKARETAGERNGPWRSRESRAEHRGTAPAANLSGVRKAAILLVAVGEELAKEVLRCLPENDVQQITEELADLRGITPELSAEVLEEFWELLDTQNFMVHGGLDYASRVLIEAFGKQRADDLMALMRRSQEAAQGNLAKLQRTDPQQLGKLLDSEHPQTIALVLAHLDPRRASIVLDNLSEEHKVVSIQRLAEMRQFSPEMAQKVAMILHRRLESVGDTARRSYSGFKAVADLLNRLNAEESKKILETIEENQPELALSIRNLMFTFEDLITVPAATIREIVSGVDKRQLALALRGANDELRAQIFKAMSSRAVEMLKEDMEVLGPVRSREVAQAQQEILNLARRLEAEGKVILKLETGDEMLA